MNMRFSIVSCVVVAVLTTGSAADEAARATATLIFAGDVMLAETVGRQIAGGTDPFADVSTFLKTADAAICNLECVVATTGVPMEGKPFTFRADPGTLPVLARHFRIVSLANNHTGDFGREAFLEQLGLLRKHGIAWFGGGRNCAEARAPHVIEIHGVRIALLGYNDYHPREFEAGPDWPGIAWAVGAQMEADIKAARSLHHADVVIPFMHWGLQYVPENDRQRKLARLMIRAGADAVIGGHPHVTQGVERFRGRLVVYSLGNFVFNGYDDGPSRAGWLLRLRVNKQGIDSWDTMQYHIDDDGIPHLSGEGPSASSANASGVGKSSRR